MTNAERLSLARLRLSYLNGQRGTAVSLGDVARITQLDAEIAALNAEIAELEVAQ